MCCILVLGRSLLFPRFFLHSGWMGNESFLYIFCAEGLSVPFVIFRCVAVSSMISPTPNNLWSRFSCMCCLFFYSQYAINVPIFSWAFLLQVVLP